MSKDMLGPIPRALVQVDTKYHGVVLNVIQRLANKDVAPLYHSRFAKALREKLPKGNGNHQHKFLKPVEAAVMEVFNPEELTRNKDIWLSSSFFSQVLSAAENFQPTDDLSLPLGFDLIEPANDSEIRSELPKDHVFKAGEFCWRLKMMTQSQPNGASGILLANGEVNIFYVVGWGGVFAVCVYWHSGNRQWHVECYRLDEHGRRLRGLRAFSRN